MTRKSDGPAALNTLAPQRPTPARAEVVSVEWLFEPAWPGRRLMARLSDGEVTLTDETGELASDEDAASAAIILAAGLSATTAMVEVVWSPLVATPRGPGVVAIDLVDLDGEPLADVPFAERRRLLESIVEPGERLRIGPLVKHPVDRWLAGWQESGFTHFIARHQNSPYLPGEANPECLEVSIGPPAPPGMMARLTGSRERVRRVRD